MQDVAQRFRLKHQPPLTPGTDVFAIDLPLGQQPALIKADLLPRLHRLTGGIGKAQLHRTRPYGQLRPVGGQFQVHLSLLAQHLGAAKLHAQRCATGLHGDEGLTAQHLKAALAKGFIKREGRSPTQFHSRPIRHVERMHLPRCGGDIGPERRA